MGRCASSTIAVNRFKSNAMWLTSSRTSHSVHGVGRCAWSGCTFPTSVPVCSSVRASRRNGSLSAICRMYDALLQAFAEGHASLDLLETERGVRALTDHVFELGVAAELG